MTKENPAQSIRNIPDNTLFAISHAQKEAIWNIIKFDPGEKVVPILDILRSLPVLAQEETKKKPEAEKVNEKIPKVKK